MKSIIYIIHVLLLCFLILCSQSPTASDEPGSGNSSIVTMVGGVLLVDSPSNLGKRNSLHPDSGALVFVRNRDFNPVKQGDNINFKAVTTTNEKGEFDFEITSPGNYLIEGISEDSQYVVLIDSIQITSETEDTTLDPSTLIEPSILKGSVNMNNINTSVTAFIRGRDDYVELEEDGAFTFEGLPEGTHRLQFLIDDTLSDIFKAETQSGNITVLDTFYLIVYMNKATVESGNVPFDGRQYTSGESVTIIGNIGRLNMNGSVFFGWNTEEDGSGTVYHPGDTLIVNRENKTLYTVWTDEPTQVVTYSVNKDSVLYENHYHSGDTVFLSFNFDSLSKESGFIGWFCDKDSTLHFPGDYFIIGDKNVELTAYYTKEDVYSITFNSNGASSGRVPIVKNKYPSETSIVLPGNISLLEKKDASFAGWCEKQVGSSKHYSPGDTLLIENDDITLYALWMYRATYVGNGSDTSPVDTNRYFAGDTLILAAAVASPNPDSIVFAGWNTQADGNGTTFHPDNVIVIDTTSLTLYARWQPVFSVTYENNTELASDETPTDTNRYISGDTVEISGKFDGLTIDNAIFTGWNTEADGKGTTFISGDMLVIKSISITLYARWQTLYTVSYDKNGKTVTGNVPVDSSHYVEGMTAIIRDNNDILKNEGKQFTGWNTRADGSGTGYAPGDTLKVKNKEITLYAQWSENSYSVFFVSGTDTLSTRENVTHGDTLSLPEAPEKENYGFAGWYYDSLFTEKWEPDEDSITENVTLYAKWILNHYTVSFNSQGGSPINQQIVNHGDIISEPTDPTRTGYTFNGWYKDLSATEIWDFFEDDITHDITLNAGWSLKKYLLTLSNSGSGTVDGPDTVVHDSAFSITATPAVGHHFVRWEMINGTTEIDEPANNPAVVILREGNAEIQAIFTPDRYNLLLTSNGNGTVSGPETVSYGIPDSVFALPFTGYHFDQWRILTGNATFGDSTSQSTTVTFESGDVELQAVFAPDTYQLSVTGSSGGSASGSGAVTHGTPVAISATAESGNHFVVWRIVSGNARLEDSINASTTVTLENGDATVRAFFDVSEYTLVYHGNMNTGGSPPTEENHIYNETITVAEQGSLTRTGYDFIGWNTESDGSGTSYLPGSPFTMGAGDDTLYARWKNTFVLAHWLFNGNVNDSSGNDIHGSVSGTSSFAASPRGQSFICDGSNHIIIGDTSSFNNLSNLTIEAWIYPTGHQNSLNTIISKVTPNRDYVFYLNQEGRLGVHFGIHSNEYYILLSDTVIPVNEWSKVAFVKRGSHWQLLCNGIIVDEETFINNVEPEWTGSYLHIGAMGGDHNFQGYIDEVKVSTF